MVKVSRVLLLAAAAVAAVGVVGDEVTVMPVEAEEVEVPMHLHSRDGGVNARIVGGSKVPFQWKKYRFTASLQDGNSYRTHYCGASLISPRFLLTAAHCQYGYPKPTKVLVGAHDRKKGGKQGVFRTVKRVIIHPDYGANSPADIALIELSSPINNIPPIKLSQGGSEEGVGKMVKVVGWGVMGEGGNNIPNQLMQVGVPVVSKNQCTASGAYPPSLIYNENICAGFSAGKKDSCQGDSGGPLFHDDNAGTITQVGVVSWGEGCARAKKYGVYARVSSYYNWIRNNVPDLPSGGPTPTSSPTPEGEKKPDWNKFNSEMQFCRKRGKNSKRCNKIRGRCVWSAGRCKTKMINDPLYATAAPTRAPTKAPTSSPTEAPTVPIESYSSGYYTYSEEYSYGSSDYSGYSGYYTGTDYYAPDESCRDLNARDCVDESACRWNLQSKKCEDYDGHLCAELVTRQSCHASDDCAWSHYNQTCVERVFIEDTCAKYGNALKNCNRDSSCYFKKKVGCLVIPKEKCTFYGTRKVCTEDQKCLWKHDPINGGNCVAQPDPCPDLKWPKQCWGNSQCRWIKKQKKCVQK